MLYYRSLWADSRWKTLSFHRLFSYKELAFVEKCNTKQNVRMTSLAFFLCPLLLHCVIAINQQNYNDYKFKLLYGIL